MTKFILAQPTCLQIFTTNYSDGELAAYLELKVNDARNRARSVSQDIKDYKFYQKDSKPFAMKCRYKTDKVQTAVKDTDHIIPTVEGRVIQKKLSSNPISLCPQRRPNRPENPQTGAEDAENSATRISVIRTGDG